MTRARMALVATLLLVVTACDPGDIDLVLDEFGDQDLSTSDDPATRAAGETAIEVLTAKEAEENLERAIEDKDIDAARSASNLRPGDPRYPTYEAALLAAEAGKRQQMLEAIREAERRLAEARPELSQPERARIGAEMWIRALREVIQSAPDFEGRGRLVNRYCNATGGRPSDGDGTFRSFFESDFPLEVNAFLALERVEANFGICS